MDESARLQNSDSAPKAIDEAINKAPRLSINELPPIEDYYLKGPELLNMRDGCEVPPDVWEPLLGELMPLWDELLVDEGDSIVVSGSTVAKMLISTYPFDAKTGKVPKALRSDVDVIIDSPQVLGRVRALGAERKIPQKANYEIYKHEYDGLEVGFIAAETMLSMDLEALDQLEAWAVATNWESLGELRELRANFPALSEVTTPEGFGKLLDLHNLYSHEKLGLRLTRRNGDLEAVLLDPAKMTEDLQMRFSMQMQISQGEYFGSVIGRDGTGIKALFLKALAQMETPWKFDSKVPLWALEEGLRAIIAEAELDISVPDRYIMDQAKSPVTSPLTCEHIYTLIKRISSGDIPFKIVGETKASLEAAGYPDIETWLRIKVQGAYARMAKDNSNTSSLFPFALPVGKYLSPIIEERLSDYHEMVSPPLGTTSLTYIMHNSLREGKFYGKYMVYLSGLLHGHMEAGEYGFDTYRVQTTDRGEVAYTHYEVNPRNLSEVMAMQLVSLNVDPEKDREGIEETVRNWTLSGNISGCWGIQEFDFDTGLDVDLIIRKMQELRDRYSAYLKNFFEDYHA